MAGHVATVSGDVIGVIIVASEHPLAERLRNGGVERIERSWVLQLACRFSIPAHTIAKAQTTKNAQFSKYLLPGGNCRDG